MLHKKRIHTITKIEAMPEKIRQLAHDLSQRTWCGCDGFKINRYYFLNDARSADGAQEYSIAIIEKQQIQKN